jgi:ferredoxin
MSSPREAQTLDGRGPRIEVDRTRCEGHGLCARTAPELLHLDQIGELVINGRELGGEALDKARAAVRACPSLPCACPKHSALGRAFSLYQRFSRSVDARCSRTSDLGLFGADGGVWLLESLRCQKRRSWPIGDLGQCPT